MPSPLGTLGGTSAATAHTGGFINSKSVWLSTTKPNVRAVLSWLVRGYAVSSTGSLPTDWDLQVKHPDGYYFTADFNSTNSFEMVEFVVNKSGYYTFKFKRDQNGDTQSRIALALAVNSDW